MKRILSAVLVLCLLISTVPMALAASLEKVGTLEGDCYSPVDHYNLLTKSIYGDQILCAVDGTVLSILPNVRYYSDDGCLDVLNGGLSGLAALDGTLIIPVEYDRIKVFDDWATAYIYAESTEDDYDVKVRYMGTNTDAYLIYDVIALYNISSKKLVEVFDRNQLADWFANGSYINIQDRSGSVSTYDGNFNRMDVSASWVGDFSFLPEAYQVICDEGTNLKGIADANGNVLIAPKYKFVRESLGWFFLEAEDELVGLADPTGKVVVAPGYEDFAHFRMLDGTHSYGYNGICCAEEDDRYTLIDSNTGIITTVEAEDAEFLGSMLLVETEEGMSIVNASGHWIPLDAKYSGTDTMTVAAGAFVLAEHENGVDLLDENGTVLVSGERIFGTPDGHILVVGEENTDLYILR